MKNVIIFGASRAGKSTLARALNAKYGLSIYHGDALREMYNFFRPNDGINKMSGERQEKTMGDFVSAFIHEMDWHCNDNGERYVLEGVELDMRRIVAECDHEKYAFVAMGYCDIDPQQKLAEIKKYETHKTWTYKYTDDEKLEFAKHGIEQSKRIKKIAAELNIPYFDTSTDRAKQIAAAVRTVIRC